MVIDTSIQQPSTGGTVSTTTAPEQQGTPLAPAAVNTGALNPAHGQPGHRCDIAVGAPLNSAAPATTTPAAVTSTPAVTTQPAVVTPPAGTTTSPAVTTTAAGMNPAHGQPGHRCDIAVGAPLNSKPSSSGTTTTPLPLTPSIPAATPVSPAPAKTETVAAAPGMNPAHGQPGHRCDIAVGAPLNSKPTQPVKKETAVNNPSPADSKVMTPAEKEAAEKERLIFEKNKEADKAPVKGN